MKIIKVWEVAYATEEDYKAKNKKAIKCQEMGYVEVEDNCDNWWHEVWYLLNWSCWSETKPINVHSSVNYCGSNVILKEDGVEKYLTPKRFGWGKHKSLKLAVDEIKKQIHHYIFWNIEQ